jgi:hypothetical protein
MTTTEGLLTNHQKALLRSIALDPSKSTAKRLHCVDKLSANDSLYLTNQTKNLPQGPATTRGRRNVITILWSLLKTEFVPSKRCSPDLIEQRLQAVKGVFTSASIFRAKSEATTPEQAGQSPVADDLDNFLTLHGVYAGKLEEK